MAPVTNAIASAKKLAPTMTNYQSGTGKKSLSKLTIFLFLLFVAYTACPIIEVPGVDLSLSALILLFIAIDIFLGGDFSWLADYSGWIILAALFWLGILLSVAGNLFFGDKDTIDIDNWKQVLRFAYWLVAFLVTIYVVATARLGPRVVTVLCWAILITALFRWGEALLFNKIGAWGGTMTMTQNGYGILFSTYAPFLLVPLVSRGARLWWAVPSALLVWGAVVINGSRGSWIAVTLGICLFVVMYAVAQPTRAYRLLPLLFLPALLGGILLAAPEIVREKVEERYATFQKLDQDKSFQSRQVLIQKGWRMFLDSPLIGAGAGNFRKETVKLELSGALRGASQQHLNRKSAHNSYMVLLSETGLAGTLPFILLLVILVWRGGLAALALARQEEFWGLGIYVGFLMMSLHLWALSGLTNTGTWVMYGLVVGLIALTQQNNSQGKTERRPARAR